MELGDRVAAHCSNSFFGHGKVAATPPTGTTRKVCQEMWRKLLAAAARPVIDEAHDRACDDDGCRPACTDGPEGERRPLLKSVVHGGDSHRGAASEEEQGRNWIEGCSIARTDRSISPAQDDKCPTDEPDKSPV